MNVRGDFLKFPHSTNTTALICKSRKENQYGRHPVWSTVRCNIMDNKRAQLKCKLLTGTYILQGNRAVFNQHSVDPTCKLCTIAPETRQHFIAECPAFVTERCELTEKLLRNQVLSEKENLQHQNQNHLVYHKF